jgi:dolichol-phosphate hexosyltransferase
MRATLIVPTLNEAESIGHVLTTFRRSAERANATTFQGLPVEWEVLVVDGASTDGTAAIAAANGARVISEPRRGYGRAYKTGFAAARGDIIATTDGDGTYPVETIPDLVAKVERERIDFLTGNRLAFIDRKAMTTEHRIGNRLLNFLANLAYRRWVKELSGGRLADSQSGFWVFRREILARVHVDENSMAFSEELKIEAIVRGLRVVEVPIQYAERWGQPKLASYRDGLHNLRFLLEKRAAVQREGTHGRPVPFAQGPDATSHP